MPLRAFIDNLEIISIDQTDEQWNDLKAKLKNKDSSLTLPCCNQEGFLRKSSKGLKHFVHAKSDHTCDWKPESPEHLRAKIEIIKACKENGWNAIPEFSEANWRADVLAIKGDKRIAFEVQWSKQTYEETIFRQERYAVSKVRGCWFFRHPPKELVEYEDVLVADYEIPAFKIFKDESSNIVGKLKQRQLPLRELVDSLLKRRIRYCENIQLKPNQELTVVFFETNCWKCKKPQHCYTVVENLKTVCNQEFHMMSSLWESESIDKNPKLFKAILQILKMGGFKDIRIGQLKGRYSHTASKKYLSHGCFYCDAIFGDFYLSTERLYGQTDPNSLRHTIKLDLDPIYAERNHWCHSEDGNFCE